MPDELGAPKQSQDSESLLKRLAGPSTTKAGLAKDQTEVNKVIVEASKGSKFYENEKRKDKDLTEKIERILKHRDEVLKGVDIHQVERNVDQTLAKMEALRDLTQIIVHVDMDAFYANVELLDNPKLKGTTFAVGHGVLTTASYEARKHGIRSGMPEYIAKKLYSDLIVLPCNFSRYGEMSKKVMSIFCRYDSNMCAASVDEGYLNITQYCEEYLLTADECVQQMRETVEKETQLTVSAGIAPNKMLAKICSDKNKPNGQFRLDFDSAAIKTFMKDLSIRKVPGVGRVNERLLDSIGIKTCGDIHTHRATLSLMDKQFGLHFLLQTFLGIASNVVQPGQREERKSIGAERTFHGIGDKESLLRKLEEVAAELENDMERRGWTGKTVTLKYKLDTYQVFTRAKSFNRWISTKKEDLFAIGKELLLPELPLKLRLIGLRVTKLKDLKDNSDCKPGSIKRFFESTNEPASPRKKRKIEVDEEEGPTLSQDGYEETMPGFQEHADADDHDEQHISLDNDPPQDSLSGSRTIIPARNSQRPRPPASAPAPSSSSSLSTSQISRRLKPVSSVSTSSAAQDPRSPGPSRNPALDPPKSDIGKSPAKKMYTRVSADTSDPDEMMESQTCPICSKTLETDNRGFNAHIDFCLSKGAIREAQAMASSATQRTRFFSPKKGGAKEAKRKKGG